LQVVVADKLSVRYAYGDAVGGAVLQGYGEIFLDSRTSNLGKAFRASGLARRAAVATLLKPGEYQFVSVETPNVPAAEVKAAMRWKLKELIDFPVEEATYDILAIPPQSGAAASHQYAYVVASNNALIRSYMTRFDEARIGLTTIDVPETAQRNISALFEQEGRGLGLLFMDESGGLLTLTAGGELLLSRRIEVTPSQIEQALPEEREDLFERVLLNLQRTIDGFERQFSQVVVGRLMCGPAADDCGLSSFLAAYLGIKVEALDLASVMKVPEGMDLAAQARFFHLIGCTLRGQA